MLPGQEPGAKEGHAQEIGGPAFAISFAGRVALLLGLVFLLAFALRVFRIDYQSIWGDEAYSIWRSGLPLSEIPWQVAKTGNLGPLYYFLLHFWQGLAGSS